tara:strand:- start:2660 stop:3031 length:372 start_codon:yes stop_codon:yes gene_type:complete
MNFAWKAIYSDGTILPQYNEDGSKNGYENIDRTRLKSFCIYGDDVLVFKLHLEPGQRLIYRRRNFINPNDPTAEAIFFYMIGWQQKTGGINTQSINYVYPDGHIEQAGIWAGGEPTQTVYERE